MNPRLEFNFVSLIMLLVTGVYLLWSYQDTVYEDLERVAEQGSVTVTRVLAEELRGDYLPLVAAVPPAEQQVPSLREKLMTQLQHKTQGLGILKIKIYDLNGLTVFSTDPTQNGEDKSGNTGFLSARSGWVASEVTFRNEFSAFEQIVENRNVLSSYIPVFNPKTGSVEGVFETYMDVTDLVDELEQSRNALALWIGLGVLILFLGYAVLSGRYQLNTGVGTGEVEELLDRLQHDADHDSLTGLKNRATLHRELSKMVSLGVSGNGASFALVYLDLDRFKNVNDTLGPGAGDRLLLLAAQRLINCVREEDMVARLGGDEFAVLIRPMGDEQDVKHSVRRILERFRDAFEIDDREIITTVSVGVVFCGPECVDADSVLRDADVAMYQAKKLGKDRYQVFRTDIQEQAALRADLESELRAALRDGNFFNTYQPIVDLQTGQITSLETLVRWLHPTRGLMNAHQFLPIAREVGVMSQLDKQVQDEAARDFAALAESLPTTSQLRFNVNVTTADFATKNWLHLVRDNLLLHGLPGNRMAVELTEDSLFQNEELASKVFRELHDMQISICLDDFGTGYASLDHLRRFPFDCIKVDAAFIKDMDRDPAALGLVQSTIDMGHRLEIPVSAEGVETREQLDRLKAMGCRFVQGTHIAGPMAAGELLHFLQDFQIENS